MKRLCIVCCSFLGLLSCTTGQMKKTVRKGEPTIYSVEGTDVEMNKAIARAHSTLDQFIVALQSNHYDTSTFALKVRFPTSKGAEHIWATSITYEDGNFYGIIDNLPELVTQVKQGERVRIEKDDISDWMYADKKALRGGYTIRLFRSRMSTNERVKFDAQFPYKIQDAPTSNF